MAGISARGNPRRELNFNIVAGEAAQVHAHLYPTPVVRYVAGI
jgi:hypothetical protein